MHQEVSKTSHKDVRTAAIQEKTKLVDKENSSQLHVLAAAKKQEFLSNQEKTVLYFAANVSQQKKANNFLNQTVLN